MDLITELERLTELYRSSALTEAEFSAAKTRLLGTASERPTTASPPLADSAAGPGMPTTPIGDAATAALSPDTGDDVARRGGASDAKNEVDPALIRGGSMRVGDRWRSLVAWYRSRSRVAQFCLGSGTATIVGFFLGGIHPVFGILMMLGFASLLGCGVTWLVRRVRSPWKAVVLGIVGLLTGVIVGFLIPFGIIMLHGASGSRPYGEMAGVAAIGWGVVAGAPIGGIAGCTGGIWWGRRLARGQRERTSS